MKKLFLILCILFLCASVSSSGIVDKLKSVIVRQRVVAGGGESYDYHETLEAGDSDGCLNWTTQNGDYDSQATVLSGNYSVAFTDNNSDEIVIAGANEYYAAVEFQASAEPASTQQNFSFDNSGDSTVCRASYQSDGDFRYEATGGTQITVATAFGELHRFKMRCKSGTGANGEAELWKDVAGSWSQVGVQTDGTSTSEIVEIEWRGSTGITIIWDELRVDTDDITTVGTTNTDCP